MEDADLMMARMNSASLINNLANVVLFLVLIALLVDLVIKMHISCTV